MPLTIQNANVQRFDMLMKSLWRADDTSGDTFKDSKWYHYGQLGMQTQEGPEWLRKWEKDNPGKKFYNRVPTGANFNKGGTKSPCTLTAIDILALYRDWYVKFDQEVKWGNMNRRFHITAKGQQMPTTELLKEQVRSGSVPARFLPERVFETCKAASRSHYSEGLGNPFFPTACAVSERKHTMSAWVADSEVALINNSMEIGNGDFRHDSLEPHKRCFTSLSAPSPAGTLLAERTFASPGFPGPDFDRAGLSDWQNTEPVGTSLQLPYITFEQKNAKKKKLKLPGEAPKVRIRRDIETLKSHGWEDRSTTAMRSTIGSHGSPRHVGARGVYCSSPAHGVSLSTAAIPSPSKTQAAAMAIDDEDQ